MKIIKKEMKLQLNISNFFENLSNEDVLFFDIETTGFIAEKSILYLIGCSYFENNRWSYIQFFADRQTDENTILEEFFKLCKRFKFNINFNGETFDIPFIIKKANQLGLSYKDIQELTSIDMYKLIKGYKSLLRLDSLKQKSVEKYLKIKRTDLYSGGELIEQYYEYLSTKSPLLELNLLLHNSEDLCGMLLITKIMEHIKYFEKIKNITENNIVNYTISNNCLEFKINLNEPSPFDKELIHNTWKIAFEQNMCIITVCINLYEGFLYHYLKDYKNYYYYTEKDEAIHKSIGKYLDPSKRITATAENCYIKKNGTFFETFIVPNNVPIFKDSKNSKKLYIQVIEQLPIKQIIIENLKIILNK